MLFNSYEFLIFFPIVTVVYFIIPHRVRYIWLLIASYYFYMCWNVKYSLLLVTSTSVTYISGLLIDKANNIKNKNKKVRIKKICVGISLIISLSALFFFKYFNFAIDNLNKFLSGMNIQLISKKYDIVLPVGISFYTLQAISYTIDVYRKEVKVERNFLKYALYISFFPQLVAGPIERAKNILSQINEIHRFDFKRFKDGTLIVLWGLFQKIVIADRIAIVVDRIFEVFPEYKGMYVVIGAVLFAFQIYCDFSGYSTIAIGTAKILGFRFTDNFNSPYISMSVSEFWRRWHISLSSWLRDYIYIPLGGNRKGKIRKYINIMIVFLISGMWHGASWSFIVWGGLNGLFQIVGEWLQQLRNYAIKLFHLNKEATSHKIAKVITTFILIDFSWIFFRANGCSTAISMIKSVFNYYNPWILFDESLYKLGLERKEFQFMIVSIIILVIADVIKYRGKSIREWVYKQEGWFRWCFYIISILAILVFGIWGPEYNESNFIYFQF